MIEQARRSPEDRDVICVARHVDPRRRETIA